MSIKIINEPKKQNVVYAIDMKPGDAGVIIGSSYIGDVVVRCFQRLVSLTNPHHTWECNTDAHPDFKIKPVDLEIKVVEK